MHILHSLDYDLFVLLVSSSIMQLWNSDHGHVVEACKDSLKKLQLDYLDLYLVHFPVATKHTGELFLLSHPCRYYCLYCAIFCPQM